MNLHRLLSDEFEIIRRLGDEVAERHPDLARFVDLQSNDPDVRQLLGGLALVAANFRERVREEVPRSSQSLLRTLFPQELRPTPSMTVVELSPRRGVLGTVRTIERGLRFRSAPSPIPESALPESFRSGQSVAVECGWQTTAAVEIAPIELRRQPRTPDGRGVAVGLEFASFAGGGVSQVLPRRLRLFVKADTEEARAAVRAALLDPTVNAIADLVGESGATIASFSARGAVRPVGLETANGVEREGARTNLLPWPSRCDEGLRLLFELAVLPAKFGFVDVDLEALGVHGDPARETAGLRLRLEGVAWPVGGETATLRPFCTVAVNLFECSARRVDLREPQLDLPLRPSVDNPVAEVFSVERVSASADETLEIPPMDAWLQASREEERRIRGIDTEHRYMLVLGHRPSGGGIQARLRLLGDRRQVPGEALEVRLLCTDGPVPELLGAERVDAGFVGLPTTVEAARVAPISPAFPARGAADALWRLLGLVGTAGERRIDRTQLLEELRFAVTLPENHRRAMALRRSIRAVSARWVDRIVDRAWRRCEEVAIDLDPRELEGGGDLALVADVLNAWARAVGPVNHVHRVVVKDLRTDQSRDYGDDGRLRPSRGRVDPR